MRLKTLEIQGFKSFAEKTALHFNENMTGIVGPNGCGKSNTIDAIRWVLGEQKSKALRLEKMDNIIFNGTKKRKPAGRAYVSLTFENTKNVLPTAFGTVTITREIFRTGESEYRLNNVKCRLKDITSLFMDTGISSDSYAIIELGMVDEILKDTDGSRRRLFEQAAGISKYKARKKETLSRLQHTDQDLARVEDLLFEIEKNLKDLERQAKRTQQYYKLKDDYKNTSVALVLHQLANYKHRFDELQQQTDAEADKKLAIEAQIAQLEADLEREKTGLITQEQSLASHQKQLNAHTTHLTQEESKKSLLTQNMRFLREKQETLNKQIIAAKQLAATLDRETEYLRWDKKAEQEQLDDIQHELNELRADVETDREEHKVVRQKLDELQTAYRQLEHSIFDLEKQNAVKTSQRDNLLKEMRDLQARFQQQKIETTALSAEWNDLNHRYTDAETQLNLFHTDEDGTKNDIAQLEQAVDSLQQQRAELQRQADAKQNEYKLTKSLVDSLEGFPDSIKFLKQQPQWNNNNAPILLDIFNCEETYKAAIENFLKPYLNNYVLHTAEEAMAGVALLAQQNKGKADFFVLNDLANLPELLTPNDNNGAIPAISVISTTSEYLPLFQRLLHQVFIYPSDSLNPSPDMMANGSIFISQSGHLIRRQSALGGGSVGAYEGKRIGKRQQLAQLDKDIKQLQAEIGTTVQQLNLERDNLQQRKEQLRKTQQQLLQQRGDVNKLQNQLAALQVKMDNAQRFMLESQNRETQLKTRSETLNSEVTDLSAHIKQQTEQRNSRQKEILTAEEAVRNASKSLSTANQRFNDQNIAFHKQQNKLNTITQNLNFKEKQLADARNQIAEQSEELKDAESQINEQEATLKNTGTDLAELYQKKQHLEKQLADAETAYFEARGTADQLEKQLRLQQKNKEQSDTLLQALREKHNQLKIQLLSLKERLHIEFSINIDDIIDQEPDEQYSFAELQEKVAALKTRIERFGEINPLAVEAYEEIKQRYDFIATQRDDLLAAKQTLLDTIKEIEDTATAQFMDAFTRVRDNFQSVFRSLFTEEDQCDLILTEPESPLESPIDIIAKPKGKRPQSINQLSGGEKSLTALALVFSLYLLKPAPFCILDEVDAPLDDANVSKFTGIIRRFSASSQFILVTHNKSTMSAVDVIYGVTMQEEGVSSVLPVDFRTLMQQ